MLTRENGGSKKTVRKVVQDFVHQQYFMYVRSHVHTVSINFVLARSCALSHTINRRNMPPLFLSLLHVNT